MDKVNENNKGVAPKSNNANDSKIIKTRPKARPVKRRRIESETSSEPEDVLPENMLETEKNLHASAVKNNLDEISVRKILKKVVTNDHVLALVKLREEEENQLVEEDSKTPAKFTRSKVKELLKVSPKTTKWKDMTLTPIKHIPVKTRPEVTALIAQELPEDEDDDEYEPTNDDVPSDDDQAVESCSDLESQPRTPATPARQTASPKVVKDGPFKVPQDVSAAKRKLELEEEDATIARRTRSKLSLSSTSIEHIESTFVPPDDIPMPDVDDLWNEFLNECLNPASTSKHEDDDETDPEYNVAADPDALDEDDDNLSKSIIKISKKELNDLVTELFAVMPEVTCDVLAENLANSVLTESNSPEISRWEGKQEILSDEEAENRDRLHEKSHTLRRFSVGKNEPDDYNELGVNNEPQVHNKTQVHNETQQSNVGEIENQTDKVENKIKKAQEREDLIIVEIKEEEEPTTTEVNSKSREHPSKVEEKSAKAKNKAPRVLRQFITDKQTEQQAQVVQIQVNPGQTMLADQVLIFQQQLRQHIQLATFNFLQLYAHPIHWSYAKTFKEFVEGFLNMTQTNPNSLANVCNLKPAHELICIWQTTADEDTPENVEMIKFVNAQSDKCRRRSVNTSMPVLDFPPQLKEVVANSPVFLYPHLLPPTAYRPEHLKRSTYTLSEDRLIALGVQEFSSYVEDNSSEFRLRGAKRPGLRAAVEQLVKHLMPWTTARIISMHLQNVRKNGPPDNPINKFFKENKVDPVEHKLLPFNPQMTLHQHPADEIPRIWLKHLAKTNERMKRHLNQESGVQPPEGVTVQLGQTVEVPKKNPLPINFTSGISTNLPKPDLPPDTTNNMFVATNIFSVVQTSTGAMLVPLTVIQNTNIVDSQTTPLMTPIEVQSAAPKHPESSRKLDSDDEHCMCCKLLRRILGKQTVITDYFKPRTRVNKPCRCKDMKFPQVSNRLKLFIGFYRPQSQANLAELQARINDLEPSGKWSDAEDLEYALQFQCRLLTRMNMKLNSRPLKKRLNTLFSQFDVSLGDPVVLAQNIHEDTKGDLKHVYNEFLGFLTAQQAENVGVFKYYFQSHTKSLIKRIEEEITNIDKRKAVLIKLKSVYANPNNLTSCQMCTNLLTDLHGYPELVKYIFSLFPHKTCPERGIIVQPVKPPPQPATTIPVPIAPALPPDKRDSVQGEKFGPEPVKVSQVEEPSIQMQIHSEENKSQLESNKHTQVNEPTDTAHQPILVTQPVVENREMEVNEPNEEQVNKTVESQPTSVETVSDVMSHTEVQVECERHNCSIKNEPMSDDELDDDPLSVLSMDLNEDSRETPDNAMVIVEKDNENECQDWTREEDKVLLEIIKQYLASQERKNKSIFQILQEKGVYQLIAERLSDKCMDDIVQRVLYLLEVLVVNK